MTTLVYPPKWPLSPEDRSLSELALWYLGHCRSLFLGRWQTSIKSQKRPNLTLLLRKYHRLAS